MSNEPEKNQPSHNDADDDRLSPENVPTENELSPTSTDDEQAADEDGAQIHIKALESELGHTKDQLLRALADAENTRRRAQREREDIGKYAVSNFARDLLDFSDNVRRAIDSIPDDLKNEGDERIKNMIAGLEAMEQQMLRTFDKHGIKKITPIDLPFDPNFHEVMFEAPGTGKPAGTIIQIIEPGYVLHDRLLRPARVGVAKDDGGGHPQGNHQVDTQA